MRKRAVSLILCLCMVLSLVPVPVLAQNVESDSPFADVEESDWFYDGVQYVFEHELMKGTSSTIFETLFEPEMATQRGMIVTILYRLDGSPPVTETCLFEDVPQGSNYENAIIWAASNGIVMGYTNTSFGPYDDITRQQMAAILYRYANVKHYDVTKQANLNVFTDSGRISNYARTPLSWANAEGLINGITQTILAPTEKVTRAQSAVILTRFCENIVKRSIPSPTATYTVTFNLNYTGAGTNQTVSVEQGKTVSEPDAPKRSGYKFKGWYTTADTQKGILFDFNTAINADITLYARWTSNSNSSNHSSNSNGTHTNNTTYYTVTFNTDSGNVIQPQSVVSGNVAVRPTDPVREGYVFGGWYSDNGFNNPYNFALAVTSNITLYAKWIENGPTTYKVSFDLNYDGADNNIPTQELNPGDTIEVPTNPERNGYIFAGWSDTSDLSEIFTEYDKGIDRDYTLYAYWVDNDDLSDSDRDGLENYIEIAYGTDKNNPDTDGDGLSDYQELMELETDPLLMDTDHDGISDYDEDRDEDTLSNGYEYTIGTNPVLKDSDFDGLSDSEELNRYSTNPMNEDTDGDGASDGLEVLYGTNPLVPNTSFTDTAESEPISELNPVSVSVTANVTGDLLGSVGIESVSTTDNPLISSTIPGYMGNAYELSADGDVTNAKVTFMYDTNLGTIGSDFSPRIYYFNPDTQELEELPNQTVENGKVSASVDHFSTYILLNKEEFDAFWDNEILSPIVDSDDKDAVLEFVFVIDYSQSMTENDPEQLCKELSKKFVSKLRDDKDQAAIVKFIRVATLVSGLTSNKNELINAIDSIAYDDGHGSVSGTNGAEGLKLALEQLIPSESENRYIVFITDGEDTHNTYPYETVISDASEADIKIYTIGMGKASESMLRKIADSTGGKYYHATATTDAEELVEIEQVFDEIEKETVDLTTDSNHDGIPDYYNQLIFEGKLAFGTGSRELIGYDFNYSAEANAELNIEANLLDANNGNMSADFDGDGLLNGEEIKVIQFGSYVHIEWISDPTIPDTDKDGLDDPVEKAMGIDPLKYSYVPHSAVLALTDDEIYCDYWLAYSFDTNAAVSIPWAITSIRNFKFSQKTTAKNVYFEYLKNYAERTVQANEVQATVENFIENTDDTIDQCNKLLQDYFNNLGIAGADTANFYLEQIYTLRALREKTKNLKSQLQQIIHQSSQSGGQGGMRSQAFQDLYKELKECREKLSAYWNPDSPQNSSSWTIRIKGISERYQKYMDEKVHLTKNHGEVKRSTKIGLALTAVNTILDLQNTISTYCYINANSDAYAECLEMFSYLSEHGNRTAACAAASEVYQLISDEYDNFYSQVLAASLVDIMQNGFNAAMLTPYLAPAAPYLFIPVAWDVLIYNTSSRAEGISKAIYLESLTSATKELALSELNEKQLGYDCKNDSNAIVHSYLAHLAQLRIMGENNFADYSANKWYSGLLAMLIDLIPPLRRQEKAESVCKVNITRVRESAKTFNLTLSPKLKDFDDK